MGAAELFYDYLNTSLGEMELCCDASGLVSFEFIEHPGRVYTKKHISENEILTEAKKQTLAYFAGELKQFDLPLSVNGTEFRIKVWTELCKIDFGKTITYIELAKRLGDEKCIRAAASANGKNPLAIIIPCHRVIGKNGSLVGYAGGMSRKKWLLEHESNQSKLF
jgi:methylated-DNA-[protein]-cysteine S-methyltransferase